MKQIWQKFVKALKRERKNPFPMSKHVINEAFEVDGIQYYEFDTIANLPWKRGLKFLSVYNELDMKCDRLYLTKHVEAIENILTGGKRVGFDEMVKVNTLNKQLKERLTWVYQEDLVYKVASVVFFDAKENPDDWEWNYAAKKIEFWKKHESVAAFFLHEPIQRLMPYLNASSMNFQSYSDVQKAIDKAQSGNISENLLPNQKSDFSNYTARYFSEEMKHDSAQ